MALSSSSTEVQGNSGRLNMSATGLFHDTDYVVVGRSVACDAPLANSNRMFRANFTSDSNGDASLTKAITLVNVQVTSIWITAPGPHGPDVCSNAFNFEKWKGILGTHGQGALGIWDKEHVLSVVERRPHSSARVSVVFQGGNGSDQFSVVGSSAACGQSAGQGYLNIALENVQVSSYTAKTVPLSQAQLDALKSFRIRNVTEGTQVGCAPLSIIAILIGAVITVGLRVVLGLTFAIATVAAWAGPVAAVDGADLRGLAMGRRPVPADWESSRRGRGRCSSRSLASSRTRP